MADAARDQNRTRSIGAVSNADPNSFIPLLADSITKRLLVQATISGTVSTTADLITGIGDGRKVVTTAGTAVSLAASTTCKRIDITAETDNTGVVVVGGSTVVASLATRRGVPLNAGDTYSLEIDDLSKVYIDSTINGDGVTFTYYT